MTKGNGKSKVESTLKKLRGMRDSYLQSAKDAQSHIDQLKSAALELDGLLVGAGEYTPPSQKKKSSVPTAPNRRKKQASGAFIQKVREAVWAELVERAGDKVLTGDLWKETTSYDGVRAASKQQVAIILKTLKAEGLAGNDRHGIKSWWWLNKKGINVITARLVSD